MKFIFLYLLIISSEAFAHGGMVAPPIDVTNSLGDKLHGGMGTFGLDDYEANEKLQKRCLDDDLKSSAQELGCFRVGEPFSKVKDILESQAKAFNNVYFQNYFAKVLFSEINPKLSRIGRFKVGKCNEIKMSLNEEFPHNRLRKSSKRLTNALSASLLYEINDSFKSFIRYRKDSANYKRRLELNYSYLFRPKESYEQLTKVIKKSLGDSYRDDVNDIYAHRDTMSVVKALMNKDDNFREKLEQTLEDIKENNKKYIKKELNSLCPFNLEVASKKFPEIFQQAIVDMPDEDRKLSNFDLCSQKFYYNPNKFDSDCDGVSDKDDTEPNDPFSPQNEWDFDYRDTIDPPFGSSVNYSMKKKGKKIELKKDIHLDFGPMSSEEKKELYQYMKKCSKELEKGFSIAFKNYQSEKPGFEDKELDFKINLIDNKLFKGKRVDFTMHKCFCSGCDYETSKQKFLDEQNFFEKAYGTAVLAVKDKLISFYETEEIPRNTCFEDLTDKQLNNILDVNVNPNVRTRLSEYKARLSSGQNKLEAAKGTVWFSQADASNLSLNGLRNRDGKCNTIMHEILHQMGLPDEYLASYYPFNRVGDHLSVMRSGTWVEPRHVWSVLSPKECSQGKGNVEN